MPFAEYVMAAGSWSLNLDPGTPRAVRKIIDVRDAGFSQLIVTDVHVDAGDFGDAGVIAAARYSGIYRSQSRSGLILSGAGLPVLMGDEEGKGNIMQTARTTASGTLTQWHAALTGAGTGVIPGDITDPGGTYDRSFRIMTFRQAWDILCQRFAVEYRVNPDRTLDVGDVDDLYGADPVVIVLGGSAPVGAGRDLSMTGVQGAFDLTVDLEDYSAKIIYLTGDPDAPTITASGAASTEYRQPNGNALDMERVISATNDDDGTPANMAAAQLGRFNKPRTAWDAAVTGGTDIGRTSPVGSYIWLYDPATGLIDDANTLTFRGAQIQPVKSRLMGIETPFRSDMGVYLRTMVDASTPVYTDLTPYVIPENGDQRLTLGALPRSSRV